MFYVNVTQAGETREQIHGGFGSSEDATAYKADLEGREPTWTVGEVYENAGDPRLTAPTPIARTVSGDEEVEVWSDGSVEPVA